MNNATFYASPTTLKALTNAVTANEQADAAARLLYQAYNRFVQRIDRCGCHFSDKILDMARFAISACATALVYDIGEIVQIVRDGIPHYGTVEKYIKGVSTGAYTGIEVVSDDPMAKGNWFVSETDPATYKARIPEGLLNLVRPQLQASCPLKEATCH